MPKSNSHLLHKVLFKPQPNPVNLGSTSAGGVAPHILSLSGHGFWDRAKGKKIVAEKGQMPKEGCPCPKAEQEDALMILQQAVAPKGQEDRLSLGKGG